MMRQAKAAKDMRYMSYRNPRLRGKLPSLGAALVAVLMLIVTGNLLGSWEGANAWVGAYGTESASAAPASAALSASMPASISSPASAALLPLEPPQEESSSPLSVELTMPSGAIVKPDASLDLKATFTNSSDSPISLSSATISSSKSILSTSSDLYSWLAGELNGRHIFDLSSQLPAQIAPHKSESVAFSVTAQERGWSTGTFSWGARGLSIEANASDTENGSSLTVSDQSVAVSIPSAELSRFPIAAAVTCQTSIEQLSAALSPLESLLETEDSDKTHTSGTQKAQVISSAWDKPGMNLFLDPMSLVAEPTNSVTNSVTSSVTNSVTSSVTPALAQLSSASLYALPAYNADLSALAHADAEDMLTSLLSKSSDARETTPTFSKNLYAPLNAADIETFLEVFTRIRSSEAEAAEPAIPILPSSALSYKDTFYFPDASGALELGEGEQSSQIQAIMANSVLSSILEGTLTLEYGDSALPLSPADIAPAALAYSAILYNQAPAYTRSIVTAVQTNCAQADASAAKNQSATDTSQATSPNQTYTNLSSLLSAPWLAPSSLENLPAAETGQEESAVWEIKAGDGAGQTSRGQAPDGQADSPSTQAARSLSAHQIAQIQEFLSEQKTLAAALPEQSDFSARAERYAYQLVNRSWHADTAERDQRVSELNIAAFLSKHVYIQESSDITIIAESSNLPLRIHSDLHTPITVIPKLDIPDSRLAASEPTSVTLQPRITTTVSIPVTAQGSGYIAPHASLNLPNFPAAISSQQLQIRLHAGWETTGVAISAGAIGLVLIIGISRSVRAGRRSKPISNKQFTQGLQRANKHAKSE